MIFGVYLGVCMVSVMMNGWLLLICLLVDVICVGIVMVLEDCKCYGIVL